MFRWSSCDNYTYNYTKYCEACDDCTYDANYTVPLSSTDLFQLVRSRRVRGYCQRNAGSNKAMIHLGNVVAKTLFPFNVSSCFSVWTEQKILVYSEKLAHRNLEVLLALFSICWKMYLVPEKQILLVLTIRRDVHVELLLFHRNMILRRARVVFLIGE